MASDPDFDQQAAHRFFAADCFNQAWDLIEKHERTAVEDETMLRLGLASQWHWLQRADCTDKNRSISYWQMARIYALLGLTDWAQRAGQQCLEVTQRGNLPPFYLGYAYEALARAEAVAGRGTETAVYLQQAYQAAAQITDAPAKEQLLTDLATIPHPAPPQ